MKLTTLKFLIHLTFIISLIASATGCVSVNIKPAAPSKSSAYKFREPELPFVKMSNTSADQAWQNPQTGNTIGVLSECSEQKDPALTSLEGEAIQALNNYQVISGQELIYQERAARRSVAEGVVDGIPVKMALLVVKKNSCAYTLTYVGRASSFQKDQPTFEKFLTGFEIP